PSFPLIPQNEKSLLLINAGMAPMKPWFSGEQIPPRKRVTTCQKCIRTPDLERVGHTARHGTFFEMLGNFSFGDYFKNEAIPWAWEFLTVTLEIPENLLWPSIYEKDEEAYHLWADVVGVPAERIVRLGKADNFWEHGSGPCGPCSEIYFDRGEKYGCGSPDCKPGCECDRYMEIWNNVFSQFNNQGDGTYTELEQKNIDTGMGLERLACVMQGVDNMFEVDTIRKVIDTVVGIAGKNYGDDAKNDVSIRVITDHVRSSMFMICDGVIPSNEGRGYVLRRIIRRACRHGKLLGINRPFLLEVVEVAIGESCAAYPELSQKADYIKKVLSMEEERFDATIDAGLSILSDLIRGAVAENADTISGEEVFKLYDTFGFPIDLTREIAEESRLKIDEETFEMLMKQQKARAREARANISGWDESSKGLLSGLPQTVFTGYTDYRSEAKIIAILTEEASVDSVSEGDCTIVLDRTPFYGEGGGQVGDRGTIYADGKMLTVYGTQKTDGVYIHLCTIAEGTFSVGDTVIADISDVRRKAIARNHSAAHLLQAALRKVLGDHVEQAGSYVSESVCRFDFTHFAALTAEEIEKVELLVNAHILAANSITTLETDIETARKNGAMALFGEKYGDVVRMVKMGDFSTELCGGTHCSNTGEVGLFKIISETSVAAGVRRIEAVTGFGVLQLIAQKDALMTETAQKLKAQNVNDIAMRAGQLQDELKVRDREIAALQGKLAAGQLDEIRKNGVAVNGVNAYSASVPGTAIDTLRMMGDKLRDLDPDCVVLLSGGTDDKPSFICMVAPGAVKKGVHAGKIIKEVCAAADGRGGGRPDSAQGGIGNASKIGAAMELYTGLVASMIK
ncbi:MAG: alanine--tRNA ligase, partial [Oscillospiraceae bacterium]|nr:alanine--tRNA ligase [Oscillospiraceae bacterium]